MKHAILRSACLLACMLAGACSAQRGSLVVIGGGLKQDNAGVWRSFVAGAGEHPNFVVVPTASQDRAAAVSNNLPRIGLYAPGAPAAGLPEADAAPGAAVASLNSATALFFTGGDQSRVTARFRPEEGSTPERDAMFALLARGGVIAGTSAGAAMMSDPMFTGGGSETALGGQPERRQLAPDDDSGPDDRVGPRTARGMGFFPYGMTDSHFFSRGRVGRLVAALEANEVRRGFGVANNRALHTDLNTGKITALGDNAALVVDVSDLKREGLSRRGVRISLMSDGDVYDASTGRLTPGGGRTFAPASLGQDAHANDPNPPDAWKRDGVLERLGALASGRNAVTARTNTFDVIYRADSRTRFSFDASGRLLTAENVLMSIIERSPASKAAASPATPAATAP